MSLKKLVFLKAKKFFFHPAIVLLVIFLIGLLLRLINLGVEPFWGDEILSLDIVSTFPSITEMVKYLADVEFHPPLYYVLIHFWTGLFGVSEFAVRSLSVLFGLAVIILGYLFAKTVSGNKKAAYLAAFILAILPMQLEYSQEARPYMIFTFFGLWSAFSIWKYYTRPKWLYLISYVLANITGLYLMYSYVFILAATALWSLYMALASSPDRSRKVIIWISVHAFIFLGFGFWLKNFLYKILLGEVSFYGLSRKPTTQRLDLLIPLVLEKQIWLNKQISISYWAIVVKFLSMILLAWSSLVFLGKILVKDLDPGRDSKKKALLFLASLFLIPIALYILSPLSSPYITVYYRHLLFINIPFAVFLGWLLVHIPWKQSLAVTSVFIFSLIPNIYEIVENDGLWDNNFMVRDMAQHINEHYEPGDLVIVAIAFGRTNFSHYLDEQIPVVSLLPTAYYGKDIWNSRYTLGIVENEYQTRVSGVMAGEVEKKLERLDKLYGPKRIWLYGIMSDDFIIHNWFRDRNWFRVFASIEDNFLIDLYVRPVSKDSANAL